MPSVTHKGGGFRHPLCKPLLLANGCGSLKGEHRNSAVMDMSQVLALPLSLWPHHLLKVKPQPSIIAILRIICGGCSPHGVLCDSGLFLLTKDISFEDLIVHIVTNPRFKVPHGQCPAPPPKPAISLWQVQDHNNVYEGKYFWISAQLEALNDEVRRSAFGF